MTTLRQAAELALDAMKDFDYDKRMAAIEAVEMALAEPEQVPVAFRHWILVDGEWFPQLTQIPRTDKDEPLYTAPQQRQWVGLTEFEITNCFGLVEWFDPQNDVVEFSNGEILEIAKAIEITLRKKNHDR
jgi:hypothetical protein